MPTFFFHSDMAGAPTNTNAAGSTLEIIRSCLVTGFNLKSVVSASVASGVMTINYAAPHGYDDKVWLRLDGAAGGSIVQRVTTADGASSLTIPAPGFADGAVAGTLSTRVAPADWEEVFTGTLKAVFRSKVEGPGSTRFFYKVDDSAVGIQPRMLRGFESMTDVDLGDFPFPTSAQETGAGTMVVRSNSATPRPWCAVFDGRTAYFFISHTGSDSYSTWFGDLSAVFSGDNYAAGVAYYSSFSGGSLTGPNTNFYAPRAVAGVPGAVLQGMFPAFGPRASGAGALRSAHPSGGFTLLRPLCTVDGEEDGTKPVRGTYRGLMHIYERSVTAEMFAIFSGVTGVGGRLVVIKDDGSSRAVAFPIDEDWL